MLKHFDAAPDDPAELKAANRLLAEEVKALTLKVEQLQHQLHGANRHRFGATSESADQLNLTFEEDEQIAEAAERSTPEATDTGDKPARQHSRKPLSEHLMRHDQILSPGSECKACGGGLKTVSEDVTEELEYVPGRFIVNRIIRPRMACIVCDPDCRMSGFGEQLLIITTRCYGSSARKSRWGGWLLLHRRRNAP